jgi:amidohydrolase
VPALLARRVDTRGGMAVTWGRINAGHAPNVIPQEASLAGTMRCLDLDTWHAAPDLVHAAVDEVAALYRAKVELKYVRGVPPVVNDADAATWAAIAAASVLGPTAVVPLGITNMAAEDFACYLSRVRGCFLRVGARGDGEPMIPAHSPTFTVAEGAIAVGAAVLAECARTASAALANAPGRVP